MREEFVVTAIALALAACSGPTPADGAGSVPTSSRDDASSPRDDDAAVAAAPEDVRLATAAEGDTARVPEASAPPSEPARAPVPEGIGSFRRDAVALALSRDGTYLAGGDLAGQALLWDTRRGKFMWADPTPDGNRLGRVVFAAVAPIYLAGSFHEPDRPWRFWNADAMTRLGELGEPGWVGLEAALDDAGARALTLSSARDGGKQKLELWDLGKVAAPLWSKDLAGAGRGAVSLDGAGQRLAFADAAGKVSVLAFADGAVSEVFATEPATASADERVARVLLAQDGALVWGSVGSKLMVWPLAAGAASAVVDVGELGATFEERDPIRGLHRTSGERRMVIVTRPIAGGLRFFGEDGKPFGGLDTGCRCETHALSTDAKVAACGCVEASELRYGAVR